MRDLFPSEVSYRYAIAKLAFSAQEEVESGALETSMIQRAAVTSYLLMEPTPLISLFATSKILNQPAIVFGILSLRVTYYAATVKVKAQIRSALRK
jgi:hypothetical protein